MLKSWEEMEMISPVFIIVGMIGLMGVGLVFGGGGACGDRSDAALGGH